MSSSRGFSFSAARAAAIGLFLVLLASCGPSRIGYGLVLWSADEAVLATGTVTPVYEESRLKQSYTVPKAGGKETVEVPTWRIRFFNKKGEAEAAAKEFAAVKDLFAISNRKALPIREKPDRLSERTYKLRENETVKILSKSDIPADENGLKGFWYEVLTEGGVSGYCFNYYLTLVDRKTNTRVSTGGSPYEDAAADILTSNWRPAFFRDMVNEKRVDLLKFKPEYGLFIVSESRQIRIVLPNVNLAFPFKQIREATPGIFIAEGSSIQMQLRGRTELTVQYTTSGSTQSAQFVAFDQEVEEVIAKERERRKSLYDAFVSKGKSLKSTAYGDITLGERNEFAWTGYQRLIQPAMIQGVKPSGKVEFSCFIGKEIREKFDGIIVFRFEADPVPKSAVFFYKFTEQGVQFTLIPRNHVEDSIVRRMSPKPLVIFFSYS